MPQCHSRTNLLRAVSQVSSSAFAIAQRWDFDEDTSSSNNFTDFDYLSTLRNLTDLFFASVGHPMQTVGERKVITRVMYFLGK